MDIYQIIGDDEVFRSLEMSSSTILVPVSPEVPSDGQMTAVPSTANDQPRSWILKQRPQAKPVTLKQSTIDGSSIQAEPSPITGKVKQKHSAEKPISRITGTLKYKHKHDGEKKRDIKPP